MATTSILLESLPKTSSEAKLVKFGKCEGFMQTLRERVDGYFAETKQSKRDHPKLYLKAFVILSWLALSYASLVFWAATWPQAILATVSLAFAMAAVGFNIQHDGGHGAFSKYPIINNLMAFTLDIHGGSSFIWKRTHNVMHHSYTNVDGVDDDIDVGFMGRLSPHQPRYGFHRFQHFYLWFLYGFISFKWQFFDDTLGLLTGKIGTTKVPRPKGLDLIVLLIGKVIFFTLAFGIPLYLHSWQHVALAFFAASFIQSFILSIVFQLAHVVEDADFPLPDEDSLRIENAWAVHQVETTVDFARNSRLVNWYTGGLNFQIEHHLFPNVCHIHYPALAKIVEETSNEYGVRYTAQPTMSAAVGSHYRWLRAMGRPESSE